jgi:hypothetical protein
MLIMIRKSTTIATGGIFREMVQKFFDEEYGKIMVTHIGIYNENRVRTLEG